MLKRLSYPVGFKFGILHRAPLAATVLVLILLGDQLIWGAAFGLGLVLFLVVVAGAVLWRQATRLSAAQGMYLSLAILATLLPLLETISPLSFCVSVTALLLLYGLAMAPFGLGDQGLYHWLWRWYRGLFRAPLRTINLLLRRYRWHDGGLKGGIKRQALNWAMPLGFTIVFAGLFSLANPIIEHFLDRLEPSHWWDLETVVRILFWLLLAWICLHLLRPYLGRAKTQMSVRRTASPAKSLTGILFAPGPLFRALVLFNLMFAGQTLMDLGYLSGGVALPEGLSYAAYAHRGAYPLVVTALLAAVFVLIAFRAGAEASLSPVIKALVFLWLAQNILLVATSVFRLSLYVDYYALTYLRAAAFIWMGLVGMGLVLIILRLCLRRSNRWLLQMNGAGLGLCLYVCCFINFADVIADYNVDHSLEVSGTGTSLDLFYLCQQGPAVLPALYRYQKLIEANGRGDAKELRLTIANLEAQLAAAPTDWRAWQYRTARLVSLVGDR